MRVLIIGGPTASGKSGLATAVAEETGGIVINGDSMQVYQGLPLLTAQPPPEDKARVPHALYEVLSPNDACTAARWRDIALAEIEKAHTANKLPVIVGGTGFYLKTLTHGISPMPEVPPAYREKAIALQKKLGNPAFNEELKKRDPETAAKLDPLNTQRNVRAWEVLEATGKGLAAWQSAPPVAPPAHLKFVTVTLIPPREELYRRCDTRFDAMLEAGALEEATLFLNKIRAGEIRESSPLTKALGYPELAAHYDGKMTLDEVREAARLSTRHYAKRQVTWFRNQTRADLALESPQAAEIVKLLGI